MENKEVIERMKETLEDLGKVNSDILSVTGEDKFVKTRNTSPGVYVSPYQVLQQYEKLRKMANDVNRLIYMLKE